MAGRLNGRHALDERTLMRQPKTRAAKSTIGAD
jgi:hypothetical protein